MPPRVLRSWRGEATYRKFVSFSLMAGSLVILLIEL
jgi:hypothetical protein